MAPLVHEPPLPSWITPTPLGYAFIDGPEPPPAVRGPLREAALRDALTWYADELNGKRARRVLREVYGA
jgi:hypothetical protein